MVRRRRLLAGAPAALALGFGGGCLGVLNGDGLRFEAAGARTEPTDGFAFAGSRTHEITREVAGQSVQVTNRVANYEKTLSVPGVGEAKLGAFALVSSPAVEVGGQEVNPIGQFDNARLIEEFASRYGGVEAPTEVGRTTLTMLGTDTEVSAFEATATYQGTEVDILAYVTKVRHESDHVVALGVHPKRTDEKEAIHSMIESVSHPV